MKTDITLNRVEQGHTYSGITDLTGMVCRAKWRDALRLRAVSE